MLFAKPPALVRETIDLVDLLRQVVQRLQQEAGPELVCRWHSEQPVCRMEADPVQLAVALRAIGQNAIEVMEAGGTLQFRLGPLPTEPHETLPVPWVEVVIEDTGPGLSAEQRQHLFDPFYSGREAGRGLGLGLSKAWRIVQLHQGRIEVLQHEGPGATFRLCLPVHGTGKGHSVPAESPSVAPRRSADHFPRRCVPQFLPMSPSPYRTPLPAIGGHATTLENVIPWAKESVPVPVERLAVRSLPDNAPAGTADTR